MFIHNFKYTFKTLLKNKALIFWSFAFPIILGTLFNMAFSDLLKYKENIFKLVEERIILDFNIKYILTGITVYPYYN